MGDDSSEDEKAAARSMLAWALTERLDVPVSGGGGEVDLEGYEVIEVLGRGAMGVVYKAEHAELGRTVALKVFSPVEGGDGLFVERLRLEGRMMAQLRHPNVVGIHDAGMLDDGTPYLVLEFVDGEDLQEFLRERGRLGKREAIRIAVKVCNALSAVHGLGIVHRDIKPGNILLGDDGVVKVSDFGISKDMLDGVDDASLTLTGTTVGTVDYMSPEQSQGKVLDARSDIYSVGVLIYEMISGVTPRGAFEPLTKWGASRELDRLVRKCLQREREKRPATAENLALQLRRIYREVRRRRRRGLRPLIFGCLAAVAAVGVMVMFAMRERVRDGKLVAGDDVEEVAGEAKVVVFKRGKWVDLLDDFDVAGSDRVGRWWKVGGTLLCHEGAGARVLFGGVVGDAYVVECEWSRVTGDGAVGLFLPTRAGTVVFVMGVDGLCGLEVLGGVGVEDGGREFVMEDGRSYLVRVDVRGDGCEAFVDGVSVGRWDFAGKVGRVSAMWGGGDPGKLGVGADGSQATFQGLRVRR